MLRITLTFLSLGATLAALASAAFSSYSHAAQGIVQLTPRGGLTPPPRDE